MTDLDIEALEQEALGKLGDEGVKTPDITEETEVLPENTDAIEEAVNEELVAEEVPASTGIDDDLEEEPKDNSSWAKMRIKLKEEKEAREQLEQRMAELTGYVQGQQSANPQPSQEDLAKQQADTEEQQFLKSEPDRFDYPDKHDAWLVEKAKRELLKELEPQVSQLTQNDKLYQQSLQEQQARSALDQVEADYRKIDADYDNAKSFLFERHKAELKLNNPQANEYELQQMAKTNELNSALQIAQAGQNPADYFKKYAVEVYGYRPQARKATTTAKQVQQKSTGFVNSGGAAPRGAYKVDDFKSMSMGDVLKNQAELEKLIEGEQF